MGIYLGIDFGTSTNYVTRWNESDGSIKAVPNLDPTIIQVMKSFRMLFIIAKTERSLSEKQLLKGLPLTREMA